MNISVIIPVYNRQNLISRAIKSVQRQSFPVNEIIIVDDGSTDQTSEIVKSLIDAPSSSKSFQIRLIQQSNLGVSAARNTGIRYARGDWLAFLDSDDEWKEEKIQKQIDALTLHPAMQICHTDEIWVRNGKRVNPMKKHAKPDGDIFPQCLPLCCVSPSSVLIKKDVLETVGLFDETLPACEDYDMWLRIFSRFPIVLVDQKLLVKYGGHEDQLSRKYWGMDRFRVRALIKILEQGSLDPRQQELAIQTLLAKLGILIQGFEKRKKFNEARQYLEMYDQWDSQKC